jgi:hypothetical protein
MPGLFFPKPPFLLDWGVCLFDFFSGVFQLLFRLGFAEKISQRFMPLLTKNSRGDKATKMLAG